MTGVAKHTVLNLLRDLGCAAAEYTAETIEICMFADSNAMRRCSVLSPLQLLPDS
jgi:hypothetical protein